jgi:hypothetical protein
MSIIRMMVLCDDIAIIDNGRRRPGLPDAPVTKKTKIVAL